MPHSGIVSPLSPVGDIPPLGKGGFFFYLSLFIGLSYCWAKISFASSI